ncbi:hypothetical protein Poli38472_009636 [Pythium oligandrum]|uniref:Glucose-6-phosphate 1-dehydrogenase n=1 Tax=Pythium oligandrum TaxID=41045 RepID=A0A8K1FKX7_PYTOL|nr:hypothetical protein Poli38472_009636 [Pythium oligandrum]|eukprot:TMW62143.1 hypothetical protein Poli38472_009636 [Pythium oligandrum]
MQSCDLVNRYLRPHSPSAFLRVVIEKPFGNDFDSAVALAHDIRKILQNDEVLLMDHYAGKMGIRGIASFFERNQAVLAPIWNDLFIQSIDIHMTETETCEHRLEFFHDVGIIRDVMVNHLQLVLGSVTSLSCSGSNCQNDHLRFIQSMKQSGQVVLGQYEGYAHGNHELSETFAATAALIGFISGHDQWKQTRFTISAAKATQQRRLQVRVRLNQKTHSREPPCDVRFVVHEGSGSSGERIELNCTSFRHVSPPQGWEAVETEESTLLRPAATNQEKKSWELGNTLSAYDFLLAEAVAGNHHQHFMNLDQVLAAWKLWTPIVKIAEQVDPAAPEHEDDIKQVVRYAIGAEEWTYSATTRAPSSHEDL